MAAPSRSTCAPWATAADVCAPCNTYDVDTALLDTCLQIASDVLFVLSGSRYAGECTDVVRPVSNWCTCGLGYWNGSWCRRCQYPYRLRLPRTPVVSVEQVKVDGVALDPARYRVENWRDLVYVPEADTAAVQAWPTAQRLERAVTETETWQVTYVAGVAPPPGGVRSAAELGCQLALACTPALLGQCQLPRGVTNVSRQNVTIALADPASLVAIFTGGGTGLPVVDLWLASEGLRAGRRPATVRVPGRRRPGFHRTTG